MEGRRKEQKKDKEGRRAARQEGQGGKKETKKEGESESPSTSGLYSSDCFPSLSKASRKKEANFFTVYSILSWRKKGQLSNQVILHAPRIYSEKLCVSPRT